MLRVGFSVICLKRKTKANIGSCLSDKCVWNCSSSSSSSSRNEYYLGGVITLLLQDQRTMSLKSVCSSRYMVTDQHRTMYQLIEHGTLSGRVRERRLQQNGLQISAEDGKRRHVSNMLWQSVPCPCGSHWE